MASLGTRVLGSVAMLAFALGASADAPKAVDLSDLRDAIATADKRGENVDDIRRALDALEKKLAKGAAVPKGAAPAELAALRRAVEAAARKGERVDAIVKELEAVEKALTGRVFVRMDKAELSAFATEVLKGTTYLTQRAYRQVPSIELADRAVDGLYLAAGEAVPDAVKQERARRQKGAVVDPRPLLEAARDALGKRDDLADARDVLAALKHACGAFDEPTTALTPEAMMRMRSQQYQNGLGEVGLQVRRVADRIEVVTPFKDGPAYKAGVRAGDTITQFKLFDDAQGKPLVEPTIHTPATLKADDTEGVLWGRVGARVELTVARPGAKPVPVAFTLARVKREGLVGHRRLADDMWDYLLDEKLGVYYVRVLDFHRADLANELNLLLTKFEAQKIKGLVLDLRFAGSGLIDTAVGVADLFVDNGLIVEMRGRTSGTEKRMGRRTGSRLLFPMVCLVSGSNGTCPELVAACLQDHKRAVIVGERTGGRASVQNYFALERGTLRITTAHAYRPSGKPLDRDTAPADRPDEWGVTPDPGFAVELTKPERDDLRAHLEARRIIAHADVPKKDAKEFNDRQLTKALEHLRSKAKQE